ncbi:putative MFS transporter [Actinoplanes missouriensis 431]|uniref:Putative MFS transporter n=1 Tax=Actinoplanes missouriensis (strain ATCC 14538 / DSM 43046 / CBS 188.64 / JCM 3121 / NBRC 102363 / NCIMB 12654 / NRRL B-3342 / UNCC 431) TaxID=512565 RepID=I0HAG8_ACTM4|nr:MFS transporter [Actinoplanes missouriensis]BAL90005.1 putative MFS transporter [Actinoplanes missouriensis 431]
MSVATRTAPPREARLARMAVALVFLTNGALYANVVPRFPQLKADLGLTNAALGSAIAAMPLGALIAGLFAAAVIRRFRSARVASIGIVLLAALVLLVAFAPNVWVLAAVFFAAGALDAIVDVAQNAHGLRVQRVYGRSILNSLHGLWSVGAVLGGLMGSAAAGLALSLPLHLSISAVLFSLVAIVALKFMLPGADGAAASPSSVTPSPASSSPVVSPARAYSAHAVRMLAVLGLLAACGALVEDAGSSWGALYLRNELFTSAAVAGLAFVALQVAMTAGRLTGDRVVDRFGQRAVVRAGGAVAALGMGLALAFPSVPATLIGFALAGLGTATLVPAAMHSADELPGLPEGAGLTVTSWLLRAGFLLSAPLVGAIADLSSLRVGLLSVVAAGLITVVCSRALVGRVAHG